MGEPQRCTPTPTQSGHSGEAPAQSWRTCDLACSPGNSCFTCSPLYLRTTTASFQFAFRGARRSPVPRTWATRLAGECRVGGAIHPYCSRLCTSVGGRLCGLMTSEWWHCQRRLPSPVHAAHSETGDPPIHVRLLFSTSGQLLPSRTRKKRLAVKPASFFRVFRQRPTLPLGVPAVPSALEGLTSVFGMGTGVAPPPLPPETKFSHNCIRETGPKSARGGDENRVVKPHGRLVPVSSTHCCAFTPGLSTS